MLSEYDRWLFFRMVFFFFANNRHPFHAVYIGPIANRNVILFGRTSRAYVFQNGEFAPETEKSDRNEMYSKLFATTPARDLVPPATARCETRAKTVSEHENTISPAHCVASLGHNTNVTREAVRPFEETANETSVDNTIASTTTSVGSGVDRSKRRCGKKNRAFRRTVRTDRTDDRVRCSRIVFSTKHIVERTGRPGIPGVGGRGVKEFSKTCRKTA